MCCFMYSIDNNALQLKSKIKLNKILIYKKIYLKHCWDASYSVSSVNLASDTQGGRSSQRDIVAQHEMVVAGLHWTDAGSQNTI